MAKKSFIEILLSSFLGCVIWFFLFFAYIFFSILSLGYPIYYLISYGKYLYYSIPLSNQEIDEYFLSKNINNVQSEIKLSLQICFLSLIIIFLITYELFYLVLYSKKICWINFQRLILIAFFAFLSYRIKLFKQILINYKNLLEHYQRKRVISKFLTNYQRLINLNSKAFYHTIIILIFHSINFIWGLGILDCRKPYKKKEEDNLEEPLKDVDV